MTAFKEWAVICRLLQQGRQRLILRKGGLLERESGFLPSAKLAHGDPCEKGFLPSAKLAHGDPCEKGFIAAEPHFYLLPTYFHQQKSGVIPAAEEEVDLALQNAPPPGRLVISAYANVNYAGRITSEQQLAHLRPFHFWADEVVQERYHRWREHGMSALIVSVQTLSQPFEINDAPEYGGCTSWVSLPLPPLPKNNDKTKETEIQEILQIIEKG